MKKSWQRLGSAFLAFLMVFTMLPASVLADSGTVADRSEIPAASGTPAVRSIINPGTDSSSYQTYRFYVEGALVDTQVVKTGDTLYAPATPAKEGHKFLGWSQSQSGGSYFTAFGVQTVSADGEVNLLRRSTMSSLWIPGAGSMRPRKERPVIPSRPTSPSRSMPTRLLPAGTPRRD